MSSTNFVNTFIDWPKNNNSSSMNETLCLNGLMDTQDWNHIYSIYRYLVCCRWGSARKTALCLNEIITWWCSGKQWKLYVFHVRSATIDVEILRTHEQHTGWTATEVNIFLRFGAICITGSVDSTQPSKRHIDFKSTPKEFRPFARRIVLQCSYFNHKLTRICRSGF